jgi:hypothetical protein
VPADLETVLLQCLRKDPDDRPSSARDLRKRLRRCQVPPWTSSEAAQWWTTFRSQAADRQETGDGNHPVTIDVDAANRLTRTAVPSI